MSGILIGLSGKKYSGKTTAANYLEGHGFIPLAFADPLKAAAREIFDLSNEETNGELKEEVNPYWGVTPRQLLQRMGTEAMRGTFGPDIWIKALFAKVDRYQSTGLQPDFVVSDVRFKNEADAIRARGGYVVRIERPMIQPHNPDTHASETELDGYDFDRVISNKGTIYGLKDELDFLRFEALTGALQRKAA